MHPPTCKLQQPVCAGEQTRPSQASCMHGKILQYWLHCSSSGRAAILAERRRCTCPGHLKGRCDSLAKDPLRAVLSSSCYSEHMHEGWVLSIEMLGKMIVVLR